MLNQILIGATLLGVTVLIQAGFTVFGLTVLDRLGERKHPFGHHHAIGIIVFFVFLTFVSIVIDVGLWAAFYCLSGALPDFEEALYFSMTTFTTLGYGDIVPAKAWRLIASFEAANGLIIFGWATAFVVAAIQHFHVWRDSKK